MYRSGIATFTLDYGKCPPWLFERMVKLGREMTQVLIAEYGADEFIKRLPQGYRTMLGRLFEDGRELSIGEWQKVALARAFLRKSKIIF